MRQEYRVVQLEDVMRFYANAYGPAVARWPKELGGQARVGWWLDQAKGEVVFCLDLAEPAPSVDKEQR